MNSEQSVIFTNWTLASFHSGSLKIQNYIYQKSFWKTNSTNNMKKKRRERDSNPRYEGRSYNGLAISRFRPLSHLSIWALWWALFFSMILASFIEHLKLCFFFFSAENQSFCAGPPGSWVFKLHLGRGAKKKIEEDHPGTKFNFPARLPTSMWTSSEFHSQVRDGLAWFHWSIEHQSISGAKLRSMKK